MQQLDVFREWGGGGVTLFEFVADAKESFIKRVAMLNYLVLLMDI